MPTLMMRFNWIPFYQTQPPGSLIFISVAWNPTQYNPDVSTTKQSPALR